jgi:hypothetical protein
MESASRVDSGQPPARFVSEVQFQRVSTKRFFYTTLQGFPSKNPWNSGSAMTRQDIFAKKMWSIECEGLNCRPFLPSLIPNPN